MEDQVSTGLNKSVLLAWIGWILFVAALLYGYYVYGPQKHQQGLDGALNPNSFSETIAPIAPVTTQTIGTQLIVGRLAAVSPEGVTVSGRGGVEESAAVLYEVALTSQTQYIFKQVQVLSPMEGGGGVVTEEEVTFSRLSAGQQVEIEVSEEQGGLTAHKVYLR
jgi:hypothetical protein